MKRVLKSGADHYARHTLADRRCHNGANLILRGPGPGRAPLLPLDAATVSCRLTRMEIAFLTSRRIRSAWGSNDNRNWEHKGVAPAMRAMLEILSNPRITADSPRVAEFFQCPLSGVEIDFEEAPRLFDKSNKECMVSLRLAQRHIDYATHLGAGNLSRGIRQAIANMRWLA